MQTEYNASTNGTRGHPIGGLARIVLRGLWYVVRLPLLATLLALEPLVRNLLSGIAVLGVLMSLFFEFIVRLPHFPFSHMLLISMGSATLLVPYYLLIRLFSTTD